MTVLVIAIILIALAYDFLNGMNDAANSIATIVSTKVLTPFAAVAWAAFFNFAAIFIFGTHVADTIGKIVRPLADQGVTSEVAQLLVLCSLLGAIVWVFLCTQYGLPISVSHALIGGMLGPALVEFGLYYQGDIVFDSDKVIKIFLFIFLAPLIGMVVGYLIMVAVQWIFRRSNPFKVDQFFRVMQLVSSAAFSLGHGGNDAQKVMGIITILLFSTGTISELAVPTWVMLLCYAAISLGTLLGGWKVIRTLGVNLTDLKPPGGFSAETAGAFTLFGTAFAGIPASTTHTVTGAIMGVGVTRGVNAVKWGTAKNILWAWVMTIPAAATMGALSYYLLHLVY
ncbi:MAG: inorganic phosphate transporter [Lewinellaceae bacterium]|nr:inorganic phosphate transporter [Saprospiraceae bacterium]MCB9313175.1 inorganic phosphate transporter [Lewinellaceae bacterium]HRW76202.1 inorganic phosphate transporter [Saprospiraceae bacterium]